MGFKNQAKKEKSNTEELKVKVCGRTGAARYSS